VSNDMILKGFFKKQIQSKMEECALFCLNE
jgi:hypothetical protein